MFRHILVPTDGSELSRNAAAQAVAIAKAMGAKLTAFHVAEPYKIKVIDDDGSTIRDSVSQPEYEARVAVEAERQLDEVKALATAAGVECSGRYTIAQPVADAIVQAAETYQCDAIVMGSHGRTGWRKLLLGSVTQKTLVSTKLPVVVAH